ncbi:hypothetical protein [Halopelagius fulvigenes]|uniref:Uncharacterized protein n=1 Tax=Halopelagius fulvigenes TaxID=1198324 RepID=A0ABD5U2L9_9EURY
MLKKTVAVGAAATGATAFAGGAAAQRSERQGSRVIGDALNFTRQSGGVLASGLITVVVQNVNLTALNDITVSIGGDVLDVDVGDVNILNDNVVKISISDVVDIEGNQVAVTVLGSTTQGGSFDLTDTVRTNL